jgi:hypothetical protein
VQPNAPGTQGYNLYAYVANNPTTWLDPSGHNPAAGVLVLYEISFMEPLYSLLNACAVYVRNCGSAVSAAWEAFSTREIHAVGLAVGSMGLLGMACALSGTCREAALEWAKIIADTGSEGEPTGEGQGGGSST